jgi:S1-C subfamily serine protease
MEVSYGVVNQRSAGFAVPINSLTQVLPRLKAQEVVRPPWLGISVADVADLPTDQLDLSVDHGVYVTGVVEDSPAQRAGIVASAVEISRDGAREGNGQVGDVIVAVAGVPVDSATEMISQLDQHQPGEEISLTVIRNGRETEVAVTLGEWPEQPEIKMDQRSFPREFPDIPREFRIPPDFHYEFSIPEFHFPELLPEIPHR